MAPLFALFLIGAVVFVILNLLPFIALVILAVVATRVLFGVRYRRHSWYGGQGWYGGPSRRW